MCWDRRWELYRVCAGDAELVFCFGWQLAGTGLQRLCGIADAVSAVGGCHRVAESSMRTSESIQAGSMVCQSSAAYSCRGSGSVACVSRTAASPRSRTKGTLT